MAGPEPPSPNIIHFLRTVQGHHVQLSLMADQKANILIGINSVVFALVVRDPSAITLPLGILAAASGLAAVLCMLAVVPAIRRRPSAAPGKPNMLFFGVFTQLPEAKFQAEMEAIMATDAGIRAAMTRDIYQLGQVLQQKKYRYLGWAYRVFMAGLVLCAIGVVVEQLW